ncbi:hypothetical protein PFISCL1PPCAC_8685, partial [Pristionchus fissidentatus]
KERRHSANFLGHASAVVILILAFFLRKTFSRLVLLKAFYDLVWLCILFFISSAKFFVIYRLAVLVFQIFFYWRAAEREKYLRPYLLEAHVLNEKMKDNFYKQMGANHSLVT